MYLALLFLILILTGIIACFEQEGKLWCRIVYVLLGIVLIVVAGFRPEGMDNDYDTYLGTILHDGKFITEHYEWSFIQISDFIYRQMHTPTAVFVLYALLGVSLKMIALRQLTPLLFASLCVYAGNYFILHDFTQIRAAVASGLMLCGLAQQSKEDKFGALLLYGSAAFFHYSAGILAGLLVLSNDRFSPYYRMLWALLIPISYALHFAGIGIPDLPIPYIGEKINSYRSLLKTGFIDQVNIFNALHLVRIALYFYLLCFADEIRKYVPSFPLLMKVWGLSLAALVLLTDLPVVAFRISELLGLVEIVTIPCIILTIKQRWIGTMGIVAFSLGLLFMQAFVNKILVVM